MTKKKSVKKPAGSNSLDTKPTISGHRKAAGQTGLSGPHSMDAIRKPRSDQRTNGTPYFGGVSGPVVSDQTYDLYNTPKKSNNLNKKKSR